jgi:hypothetical protein
MREYVSGFKKIDKQLSEEEVIDILINSDKQHFPLKSFSNVLYAPMRINDDLVDYTGFYVAKLLLREELGFKDKKKPGDFDIIIIPFSDTNIYFDRTVAAEVKVVRPTRKNPSRNANSLGVTQLFGLIEDGFPFVSLVHITMPEALKESEMQTLKFANRVLDMDNPKNNIGLLDDTRDVLFDWLGMYSAVKQMQRLLKFDVPKYAGLYRTELSFFDNGSYVLSDIYGEYNHFNHGYFNPKVKLETINNIKQHFKKNPSSYQILLIPPINY